MECGEIYSQKVLQQSTNLHDPTSIVSESTEDHYSKRFHGISERSVTPSKAYHSLPEGPLVVELPNSSLTNPRSTFEGFTPPFEQIKERFAANELITATTWQDDEDFIEFHLNDFVAYIDTSLYPQELRPLHQLAIKNGVQRMYFDGIVSAGDKRFFLKKVPFEVLPIGNYGISEASVESQIWIQSTLTINRRAIYYKLGRPSLEYERYFTPFLWIADLAKHVIDFCERKQEERLKVVLHDFRAGFHSWLQHTHGESAQFRRWQQVYGQHDFRTAIVANMEFIWKETFGVLGGSAGWHTFWQEIRTFEKYPQHSPAAITDCNTGEEEAADESALDTPKTVVTPYIYRHFSHMKFGDMLQETSLSLEIKDRQRAVIKAREDCTPRHYYQSASHTVTIGTVISTWPDEESEWKQERSSHDQREHVWYGLVQNIYEQDASGYRTFDVLWLYRPIETPCAIMKYPWPNELFLSDLCNCANHTKIKENEILQTHSVDWNGLPDQSSADFFVRQTYIIEDRRWVTFRRSHLRCHHHSGGDSQSAEKEAFRAGETVLVASDDDNKTRPFQLLAIFRKGKKDWARLRKLAVRTEVDPDAKGVGPNEVVWTDQIYEALFHTIEEKCYVRFFDLDEAKTIPSPYDRCGIGNMFYMTHQMVDNNGRVVFVRMNTPPGDFRQGFHPSTTPRAKLRGLDLFCGGGNFGRGIEEGGAVKMHWANDIWPIAMHTYMANSQPGETSAFLGSVDDLHHQAMEGVISTSVPLPGDVDFISGGSPCQGFSRLTNDKTTRRQKKNQSLVASFASFIDLYRPQYGVLENVNSIIQLKDRHEDVFSQLLCVIVGLGYQTQIMWLDAWSYGASQSRDRIFLCFAAPGLRLPRTPGSSHSHIIGPLQNKVGRMSNGQPIQCRRNARTPFKFIDARHITADLPSIGDGKADCCIQYPDHRVTIGLTPPQRARIAAIPTRPYGMNFSKAWYGGYMTRSDRECFQRDGFDAVREFSRAYGRIRPNHVFGTITTTCSPADARTGAILHWQEPRTITLMEARRAQGFLDHEVLLGTLSHQWKIVGNSVARPVALAIGLAVREAWFGTLYEEDVMDPAIHTTRQCHLNDSIRCQEVLGSIRQHVSFPDDISETEMSETASSRDTASSATRVDISTVTTLSIRKRGSRSQLIDRATKLPRLRDSTADSPLDTREVMNIGQYKQVSRQDQWVLVKTGLEVQTPEAQSVQNTMHQAVMNTAADR